MSEYQVTTRYAKSLIGLAEEQNLLEEIKADMSMFVQTLKENSVLNAVLRNPIVPSAKKTKILNEIFKDKVQPATLVFFKIMIDKMRSGILFETALEFVEQYNQIKHIVKASIVSAQALSENNRKGVMAIINNAVGGKVILTEKVDLALIGGFIITVGDRQFDTSISGTLNKLAKEFKHKTPAELA